MNGHRIPPEEELRRLVAGRPALERRVDTLLRLFEQPSADPGSFEEIEDALRRVGLRTEPPLDGQERNAVVSLVPGARPSPLRVPRIRRRRPHSPAQAEPAIEPARRPEPKPAPPRRPEHPPARARPPEPEPAPKPSLWRRLRRAFPVILLVFGALLLTEAAVTVAWKEPFTALIALRNQHAAANGLKRLEAAEARQHRRVLNTKLAVRNYIAQRAIVLNKKIGPGGSLGRLKIPALGLNFVVVQSTLESSLQKGPAHYRETPLPGTPGHWTVGIAGHRTTYLAPFRHIDDLKRGDRVFFTLPYARFIYTVEKTRIVDAGYQGVMRPIGHNRLALTACHPPFSAAQRIIVYARLRAVQPRGVAARWSRQARERG